MAGLVFRSGNGKNMTYSGSRYVNPSHGTRKLCIRTGTGSNDIIRYGLTSNSSASQYCGIRMRVDGKVAYIGCAGSFTTVGTHVQSSVTSYRSEPGVTETWITSGTVWRTSTENVSVGSGTYTSITSSSLKSGYMLTTRGCEITYAKNTTLDGHATTIVAYTSSYQTEHRMTTIASHCEVTVTLTTTYYSTVTKNGLIFTTWVASTSYARETYYYSTYTASHRMTMYDNINM